MDVLGESMVGLKLDQSVLVLGVRVGKGEQVVPGALIGMVYAVGVTGKVGVELDHVGWQALI